VRLPLMRAYFTPDEIRPMVDNLLMGAPSLSLGGLFHVVGGKADAWAFMRQEGIPCVVWHLVFKHARKEYRRRQQSKIESLVAGKHKITVHRCAQAKHAERIARAQRSTQGSFHPVQTPMCIKRDAEDGVQFIRPATRRASVSVRSPKTPMTQGREHAMWLECVHSRGLLR